MSPVAADLEPFVTPTAIREWLGEPSMGEARADFLARAGSAAVRAEVSQIVNVVQGDPVVLNGSGSELVLLPELEVLDVASVTLAGDPLVGGRDFEWDTAGRLYRTRGRRWPLHPRILHVVYDHGWWPWTAGFQAAVTVCLEVAARVNRDPGLQSERIGDWSRAFVPTAGRSQPTESEKRTLDPLRRER